MDYNPDKWLMVNLTNVKDSKSHYRIFATWYGGYLGNDTWKLNSGVTTIDIVNDVYSFAGSSGSVYHCHKDMYGSSGYGHGVLQNLIAQSKEQIAIEVMPKDTDFLTLDYTT